MMYPYAEFLIDFERRHPDFAHQNFPENTRAAIIIETRPHYFLPLVIRNVMHFLGPRWNLHVVCGEPSYPYAVRSLQGCNIRIIRLPGVATLPTDAYNKMLLTPDFWNLFGEEKLLMFQTDTLLAGSNWKDFESFDYAGAPCRSYDANYIANGGLSLRTRSVMLRCLADFRARDGVTEDVYYTEAVRAMGARMPDHETAARFAVESIYVSHPFGVHGTDKIYHSVETAQKIVSGIIY
jgi:hypothetical protein